MIGRHQLRFVVGAASLASALTSGSVMAQDAGSPVLEEIVVTAQRREEDLQKTPIAVTALSTQTLEERSVTTAQDLMQVVPSLQVSTQTAGNGSGSATFFLRGLGQQRSGNGSQPAVGIYVDDFYYPSLNGTVFSILDIQQVEVLRGPQGTLFGRNTIGGAIRYTTKKPEKDLGGSLTATLGSFSRKDFTGMLNLPLGEIASFRMTVGNLDSDGFVKREFTGGYAGGSKTQLIRGQLRFEPSTAVTLDLEAQYNQTKVAGYAYRLPGPYNLGLVSQTWNTTTTIPPAVAGRNALGLYDSRYAPTCDYCQPGTKSALTPEEYANVVSKSSNGVVAWNINDTLTLKSLTGYTQVDTKSYTDLDGTPLPVLGAFGWNFVKAFSQEFQLSGRAFSDSVKWVGGVYYNDEAGEGDGLNGIGAVALNALRAATYSSRDTLNEAAFIDATWQTTEAFSILGGYRYSTEEKNIYRRPPPAPTASDPNPLPSRTSRKFSSSTGRLGVQYQWTPDVMSYFTISQGFRSGGFNVLAVPVPVPGGQPNYFEAFDPETSTTFELGGRLTLMDNRLRLNPTVFYNKWDSIQVQRFDYDVPSATQVIHLENAGKAHTYGLELEVDAAVTRALHVFGNVATLTAKYDDVGRANSITKNSKFQRAPELTYALGASYTVDMGTAGSLTGTVNYNWQDDQRSTPTDTTTAVGKADTLLLPSYSVTNVRVEYKDAGNHWSVAAFATNVFDEFYFVGGVSYPESSPHFDLGRPREFGVTARFKF